MRIQILILGFKGWRKETLQVFSFYRNLKAYNNTLFLEDLNVFYRFCKLFLTILFYKEVKFRSLSGGIKFH